jgi:hypothetical protein
MTCKVKPRKTVCLVDTAGVEPDLSPCKGDAFPLCYRPMNQCNKIMIDDVSSNDNRQSPVALFFTVCPRTRTSYCVLFPDPSVGEQFYLVGMVGIEPTHPKGNGFTVRRDSPTSPHAQNLEGPFHGLTQLDGHYHRHIWCLE